MKTLLRRTGILLGFLLIITWALGQTENTDARFLSLRREYVFHRDGSHEFRESFVLKLLTHRAFHRQYGESFIVYNPKQQKLKINKAVTVMADGRKVPAPANAFNEVLPSWASGNDTFHHLREMVVSHTGLEVGATIEFDYSLISQTGYYLYLSGSEVAAPGSPADSFVVVIKVPAGVQLNYRVLNLRLAPEVKKEKDMMVYTFNFGAVKALPQASFLPDSYQYLPALIFTTGGKNEGDWQNLFPDDFAPSAHLKPVVNRLLEKLKTENPEPADLLNALRNYVFEEYASLNVKPIYTGGIIRTFDEVWNSRSATPAEKSAMLSWLLNEMGFSAHSAFSIPSPVAASGIIPMNLVTDFYVIVESYKLPEMILTAQGNYTRDMRPNLYGYSLIYPDKRTLFKTWEITPVNSEFHLKAEITIDTSAMIFPRAELKAEGLFNFYFGIGKDNRKVFQLLNQFFRSSGDTDVKIQRLSPKKLEAELSIKGVKALREKGEVWYLELPHAAAGVDSWNACILNMERDVPFSLPAFVLEQYEYTITVPEGWELVNAEAVREVKYDYGGVSLKLKKNGNQVIVQQAIEFILKDINVGNYGGLREILLSWCEPSLQTLVFRKRP